MAFCSSLPKSLICKDGSEIVPKMKKFVDIIVTIFETNFSTPFNISVDKDGSRILLYRAENHIEISYSELDNEYRILCGESDLDDAKILKEALNDFGVFMVFILESSQMSETKEESDLPLLKAFSEEEDKEDDVS